MVHKSWIERKKWKKSHSESSHKTDHAMNRNGRLKLRHEIIDSFILLEVLSNVIPTQNEFKSSKSALDQNNIIKRHRTNRTNHASIKKCKSFEDIDRVTVAILLAIGMQEDQAVSCIAKSSAFHEKQMKQGSLATVAHITPEHVFALCRGISQYIQLSSLRGLLSEFPWLLAMTVKGHVLPVITIIDSCLVALGTKTTLETILHLNPSLLLLRDMDILSVFGVFERMEIPLNKWPAIVKAGKARVLVDINVHLSSIQMMKQLEMEPVVITRLLLESITALDRKHTDTIFGTLMRCLKCLDCTSSDVLELFSKFPKTGHVKTSTLMDVGKYLRRLGVKQEDIFKIFLKYPRLGSCYKSPQLKRKLGYILRVMRLPHSMVLDSPVVLSFSLERIGSRLEYVRIK